VRFSSTFALALARELAITPWPFIVIEGRINSVAEFA